MKEFREEKEKLEAKIKENINDFEEKYNCYITNVDLIHTGGRTMDGKLNARTKIVNVDFKLCDD